MKTKFQFTIVLLLAAIISNAQNTTSICLGDSAILTLSAPSQTLIQWQESADSITFTDIAGANSDSLLIPSVLTSRYFRAQLTGENCNPYFTDIQFVDVLPLPTVANAGTNITAVDTFVTLNANAPAVGVGEWSIISGLGGTLTDPNDPQTLFTGLYDSTYVLVWTISSPPCGSFSDTISITMPPAPPLLPFVSCNGTLYVHPTDNSGPMAWGCVGIVTNATDDNDGAANTALIVAACAAPTAANICDTLTAFGFNDWYLPANNELECLRQNEAAIGGFQSGGYWSSTEGASFLSANARYRTFPTGVSGVSSKTSQHRVRCVRR